VKKKGNASSKPGKTRKFCSWERMAVIKRAERCKKNKKRGQATTAFVGEEEWRIRGRRCHGGKGDQTPEKSNEDSRKASEKLRKKGKTWNRGLAVEKKARYGKRKRRSSFPKETGFAMQRFGVDAKGPKHFSLRGKPVSWGCGTRGLALTKGGGGGTTFLKVRK